MTASANVAWIVEQRRARKVRLALAVAPDVAVEAVVGEPVDGRRPHDLVFAEPFELGVAEPEPRDEVEQAPGARDDAVAAPVGQASRERLEEALAVGGAVEQGGIDHRQLVSVGEERSRPGHADEPSHAGGAGGRHPPV